MPNWDDMSDREKDAWGAEYIMGWYLSDVSDNGGHWNGEVECLTLVRFVDMWKPSTDAAADYEILKRVRETWGTPEYNRFSDALSVILWKRYMADEKSKVICEPDGTSKADYDGVWLIKYLKEGDYLHAAFLAKNGE